MRIGMKNICGDFLSKKEVQKIILLYAATVKV